MGVINNQNLYQKFLLNILNSEQDKDSKDFESLVKVNIYLALLSLNNHNYQTTYFQIEHDTIDDFLRKVNNLKVKIQLKRKLEEIEKLSKEILNIYKNKEKIIAKYNKENLDIDSIINSYDSKEITSLIDKLTKVKLTKIEKLPNLQRQRQFLEDNIFKSKFNLEDDCLIINNGDNLESISLIEFYEMFDYLLDINNYKEVFLNKETNEFHNSLIKELISLATSKEIIKDISSKQIIPLILTYILTKEIINLNNLNTSDFKIDNIKITDLYSFASLNNEQKENSKLARWNKVIIPNDYLYSKIKGLIAKGMYYYQDDLFILESIDHKTSDFKVSISIEKITDFLKEILSKHLESF